MDCQYIPKLDTTKLQLVISCLDAIKGFQIIQKREMEK